MSVETGFATNEGVEAADSRLEGRELVRYFLLHISMLSAFLR